MTAEQERGGESRLAIGGDVGLERPERPGSSLTAADQTQDDDPSAPRSLFRTTRPLTPEQVVAELDAPGRSAFARAIAGTSGKESKAYKAAMRNLQRYGAAEGKQRRTIGAKLRPKIVATVQELAGLAKPVSGLTAAGRAQELSGLAKLAARQVVAGELAPAIGLHPATIANRLKAFNDDRQAVIRYYQTHGARTWARKPIVYEGRSYPTREALAIALAETIGCGRTADAISSKLRRLAGDVPAVVDWCRQTPVQPRLVAVTVDGVTYASPTDFVRKLSRHCGASPSTAYMWVSRYGLEAAMARAKAYAARKQRRRAQRPQPDETVVVFGWRWRSVWAMQRYYNLPAHRHFKSDWEEHIGADKPGCLFPVLSRKLTRLWEVGDLNEWNRFDAAVEAKMPRGDLPLNQEPELVDDPRERVWIDALAPPETITPRRAGLRELEEMRRLWSESRRARPE